MKERCFIIGSLAEYSWKVRMANMERRVNSKNFQDGRYEAVSPRVLMNGEESKLKRYFKLRRAIRSCSAVYALREFAFDQLACRLVAFAERKGKTIIYE